MAKKFRGSSVKRGNLIEMYGVSELLKSIEKAGGKVDEAVKKSGGRFAGFGRRENAAVYAAAQTKRRNLRQLRASSRKG